MRDFKQIVQNAKFVHGIALADHNNNARAGDWVCMKNYGHLTVCIITGTIAAGADDMLVTLNQATSVAGAGAKNLLFREFWAGTHILTSDTAVRTASTTVAGPPVDSNFTIDNAGDDNMYFIEIHAEDLDVENNFDCVQVAISSPGANSALYTAFYLLSSPRYVHETMPSAIIN